MKNTTILAIAATLMLGISPAAMAQTATTAAGAATDAAAGAAAGGTEAGATAGANAAGNATINTDGASASGGASFTFDANADGTISADEIAAANTTLSAQTGTTVSVDADGDGVLSETEIANANGLLTASASTEDTVACGDSGIEGTITAMGSLDTAMLATATNVRVVTIADCETADVTAALAAEGAASVQQSIGANSAAVQAIQARGASVADVLGATSSGDTLTVYVATAANAG
ncbi:MAG: hypothetical protein EOP19_03540 [Hyphomicrobiales bacterium]|nr:MAG: hypothetical protein EOP19_03540 [Hyphomicrobiales bacterium]